MLPLVVPEQQIFGFEFWFDGMIHQGLYYRGELFCRLGIYDIQERAQAYRLGIRLAQKEALIILSCGDDTCNLWGSLRAPIVKDFLTNPAAFSTERFKTLAVENSLNDRADE